MSVNKNPQRELRASGLFQDPLLSKVANSKSWLLRNLVFLFYMLLEASSQRIQNKKSRQGRDFDFSVGANGFVPIAIGTLTLCM
jgi:hypothetical protein